MAGEPRPPPQAPSLHRYRPGCWEACLARCRRSRTNAWASRSPFRLSSSCRIGSPAKRCLRVRLARRGAWRVAGSAVPPRPPEPRDGPTQPRSKDSLADKTGEAFAVPLGSSASRNAQPSCSTRG